MYFDYKSVVKGISKEQEGWLSKDPRGMSEDDDIDAT